MTPDPTPTPPQDIPGAPTPPAAPPSGEEKASESRPRRGILTRLLGGHRLSRRVRWVVRILIILPVIVIALALIVSHSPLVEMIAARKLTALLGCEVHIGTAIITVDGRLVIRDLSLRVPGMDGQAGEFMSADRAEADLDWSGLLVGAVHPLGVRLQRPVFRVSQSTESGAVNLEGLHPSPTATKPDQPPRIDVIHGTVELGEHEAGPGGYRTLTRLGVDGFLAPQQPGKPVYTVRLHETGKTRAPLTARTPSPGAPPVAGSAMAGGMVLEGMVDLRTSAAKLELMNLELNVWGAASVPQFVREVWGRLNMRGRIPKADFEYDPKGGLSVSLTLENVSMDALVPNASVSAHGDDMLSLSRVNGGIRVSSQGLHADLNAIVEDQTTPSQVILTTQGTRLDSALKCQVISKNFRVEKDPALLPFLPEHVRTRLATFSGPTAVVDTEMMIERGAPGPGGPAPFNVSGWARLRHASAAFDKFPYPFNELSGLVEFNDEKIEFKDLIGFGPTGAKLTASGIIAPPDETSEVTLHIVVTDVPVDEVLERSLPEDRKPVIGFLFDRPGFDRLVGQGLIVSPQGQGELREKLDEATRARGTATGEKLAALDRQIADLEHRLQAPSFEFGGVANFDVTVHSLPGHDSPWEYTVTVEFPRAGLVPKVFPLPVAGTDVALEITPTTARLLRGTFQGASGGTAVVNATVGLETSGEKDFKPTVHIEARDIPVDDLLLAALPEDSTSPAPPVPTPAPSAQPAPPSPGAAQTAAKDDAVGTKLSPKKLLRDLNLTGTVDASAHVTPKGENDLALELRISLDGLTARPAPAGKTALVELADLTGVVLLSEERLAIPSITGKVRRLDQGRGRREEGSPGGRDGLGTVAVSLAANLPKKEAPPGSPLEALHIAVAVGDFDLAAPIGDTVEIFSPKAAAAVEELRAKRDPEGHVDAHLTVDQVRDGPVEVAVDVTRMRGVALDALENRLTVEYIHGDARYISGETDRVAFTDFTADVKVVQPGGPETPPDPATRLTLSGEALVGTGGARSGPGERGAIAPAQLVVEAPEVAIESSLVRAALERAFPASTLKALEEFEPRGVVGAVLRIETSAGDAAGKGKGEGREARMSVGGEITPRTVTIVSDETEVTLDEMTGRVVFEKDRGRIEKLTAKGMGWGVNLDGGWDTDAQGDTAIDVRAGMEADSLGTELKALLPATARDLVSRLKLELPGRLEMSDAHLKALRSDEPSRNEATLDGTFRFAGGRLDVGLPVTDCDGSLWFRVERPAGAEVSKYDFSLVADRLSLSGLMASNLRARVLSGSGRGQLLMPLLSADCAGGRITAQGVVTAPPSSPAQCAPARPRCSGARAGLPDRPDAGGRAVRAGAGRAGRPPLPTVSSLRAIGLLCHVRAGCGPGAGRGGRAACTTTRPARG